MTDRTARHLRHNPRVVTATNVAPLAAELRLAGAAAGVFDRMRLKAESAAVVLEAVDAAEAEVVARAMATAGGEVACGKGPGGTTVVLAGSREALASLVGSLRGGAAGFAALGDVVNETLEAYGRRAFELELGSRRLRLGPEPVLMGVVNVTPDSFSDGGLYLDADRAVERARRLSAEGAAILDVGGESTRPGSEPVPEEEELSRVLPVVEALAEATDAPISIDTRHARVAREAVRAGASIVNDVTGLQGDPGMARAVAETGAGVVIMHILGTPKTMQERPEYGHLMADICRYLRRGVASALEAGVPESRIIVDPGIGFGKRLEHNVEILGRLGQLRSLGRPILVGPSRKRFIGELADVATPADRTYGTAAACAMAAAGGALILRVHDVGEMRQAMAVAGAIARSAESAA